MASKPITVVETVQLLIKRLPLFAAVVLLLFTSAAVALPKDLRRFTPFYGGLVDIEDGAYVEGSIRNGGRQPDYKIDLKSKTLKTLMQKSKFIGDQDLPYWDKVGAVIELLNYDFFKYRNYDNPYYLRLLKKYRLTSKDVPLSQYGVCQAGVCREHALVLHFALKAAGIENRHAYAKIYRASRYYNYEVTEDHAFNVITHEGTQWVVDAYYWGFNGFRLQDLMSPQGITEYSPTAPIARPQAGTRRIIEINRFPVIYNPKPKAMKCELIHI